MPSSLVLECEPTNTDKPSSSSPIAGPSGITYRKRVSDAKRQLFDDSEEEYPRLDISFLDGSGREDEPILTVKTVNLNDSSSSDDLPLASFITGSRNQLVKWKCTNLVTERVNPEANKFNFDVCPLLIKYKEYLTATGNVSNPLFINTPINYLNKVLYFLNSENERVESICDISKLNAFFIQMPAEMSIHYYNNYIKAILRFSLYCK
ncbi:hypothetical protein ACJMK2_028793 [Sinanodonta woodiana]|uniref:Uncharacterized protein n=1 Tax=Sinanodonta woodiana TaxID=1069815 RepID=A0ABD3X890_SINWO